MAIEEAYNERKRLRLAGILTSEQRLIIDNASEEQGNSDQSIEKIITVDEDVFNRSIGEDEGSIEGQTKGLDLDEDQTSSSNEEEGKSSMGKDYYYNESNLHETINSCTLVQDQEIRLQIGVQPRISINGQQHQSPS